MENEKIWYTHTHTYTSKVKKQREILARESKQTDQRICRLNHLSSTLFPSHVTNIACFIGILAITIFSLHIMIKVTINNKPRDRRRDTYLTGEERQSGTYSLNFSFHRGLRVCGLTEVARMILAGIALLRESRCSSFSRLGSVGLRLKLNRKL